MNLNRTTNCCIVAALLALSQAFGLHTVNALQPASPDTVEGLEVLTRGPVHEAFAETVTFDPEPGLVVAKAPPVAIDEAPPELRPEGDNVAWIPGYWAWDDERSDYLWVSGIWRALPPGRQWVPGYWSRSREGAQWTSGYWADNSVSEVQYLPEPPGTMEVGPNLDAPSADQTWLPGCWVWQQNRYAWRPGYWATGQSNWDWVPAHYVWTPRGYVFVDGYNDYTVARRGILFAPVYFNSSVYSQRGFSYSPVTVIQPTVFATHLFLRPSYGHYYFGDYYGSTYTTSGFSPWFSFYSSRYGYDPFYAHQRWHHRSDRQWDRRVEADFAHRRDHPEARPPRTWTAQRALMTRQPSANQNSFIMATSLNELAKSKETPIQFRALNQQERQTLAKHGQDIQKFRQERQKLETRASTSDAVPSKQVEPARVKLPRSPILAKSAGELGEDHALPQTHVAPKPDPTIEPKPRVARPSKQPQRQSGLPPRSTLDRPDILPVEQPGAKLQRQPRGEKPAPKTPTVTKPRAEQPVPQTKTAPKPQPQRRVEQTTPRTQTAPKTPPQPQVEPAQVKPAPRREQPRPQPTPQAKPTSQSPPRVEQPRPQPQAKPQPQPRPQPQAKPQPQPRPQPQAQPQSQPRPQPQAKPQPQARPQPQPKVDLPTAPPQPGSKENKHKGKD